MATETSNELERLRWLDEFQAWTRPRILAAAQSVAPSELRRSGLVAGGNGDGSVFATLVHLVGATLWLARWRGEPYRALPGTLDYPDLASIASAWETAESMRRELLGRLKLQDLQRQVRYRSVTLGVMEQF